MAAGAKKRAVIIGTWMALVICIYSIPVYTGNYSTVFLSHIIVMINAIILGLNIGLAVLALVFKKKQNLRLRLEEAKNMHELIKNREMAAKRLHLASKKLKLELRAELKCAMGIAETCEARADEENTEAEWDERYCLNTLADTVLRLKADECGRKGIRIDIDADIPSELRLTEAELCSLISNLLDNAIEASEHISDPSINFRAYINKACLIILVTNAASAEYARRQKRSGRGMGLYIVKSIAEKYNGEATMEFDGESFKACVIVEAL